MRHARKLPKYQVGQWTISKLPCSFGSPYAWEATLSDSEGYLLEHKGFNTLREARAFCQARGESSETGTSKASH